MSSIGGPVLDDRDEMALVAEFRARRAGYLPQWNPPVDSAGAAIEQVFAHLVEAILKRLNQAPDKNRLAFFSFLGLDAAPAAEARAPIVFSLNPQAGVANAPAGTQVAAPPPPGATAPIVFEIERGLNISAAALTSAATLWPGRDEYVDHTTALASHQPFTLFDHTLAQGTPHGSTSRIRCCWRCPALRQCSWRCISPRAATRGSRSTGSTGTVRCGARSIRFSPRVWTPHRS